MCSIAKLLQENMEHRTLVVDLLADGEVVPIPSWFFSQRPKLDRPNPAAPLPARTRREKPQPCG